MKKVYVGMIGYKFMGKAHSNAWIKANQFFNISVEPVRQVVCGRNEQQVTEFANRWGWKETSTDWHSVIERDDIDIIDICAPPHLHYEIAMAALQAGKHVFCEKPLTLTVEQARTLWEEAKLHPEVVHYLNHNYRRTPAVQLAKQFIDQGKIGTIYHWRGAYLQDWIVDPAFPLTWHLRKETAGMGPQADLNSHSVDLARFLVGDIQSVSCMTANFITERPLADEAASGTFSGTSDTSGKKGSVTVEDAAFMLAKFENGTLGSFETSRFAPGRKNYNYFEIYGSKGSILFNLERMNELEFYNLQDPPESQGFKTIIATENIHPYIAAWWPPGHIIGYEHGFVHAAVDFLEAINKGRSVSPNFYDGMREMEILTAGITSAETKQEVFCGPGG